MNYPLASAQASGFRYIESTGSTNQDLLAQAGNLPDFFVLATDYQTAGRGRMDRSWIAGPRSSIMASILFRPSLLNQSGLGWLSLMVALSITETLRESGIAASLKWPNDVLIGEKKVAGVLAEALADQSAVVVGFGINVNQSAEELPAPIATSIALEGLVLERDWLLASILQKTKSWYRELSNSQGDADSSALRQAVISHASTVGAKVRAL